MHQALAALRAAVTQRNGSVALTQAQIDEIVLWKPATDDEQRLQRIAEWSKPRYALDNRFVHLTLQLDKGHDAGDPQRKIPVNRTFSDLRDILQERKDDTALILLGEPGAGKSTLLRRLQLDDSIDRLRDGGTRLSFFISLNNNRPEKPNHPLPSPREWLTAAWAREYPALEPFDALLKQGRMLLLIDALNEIPHGTDEEYRRRIELWQAFLVSMRSDHRANRALITCRTRDYAVLIGTKELPVPRVDIQRMSDDQVREFLDVYLPDKAAMIWDQLKDTPQLDLFRTPYYLRLLTEQVERFGTIPAGRAGLFTGFVRETLLREIEGMNRLFLPDGLLDADDCHQVQQSDWRDEYELPEGGCLISSLTRLAYLAQESGRTSDGAQVRLRDSEARTLIDHALSTQILRAGVDLTVLDKLGRDIQFFHQLLQEFFAARQLAVNPNPALVMREWHTNQVTPSLAETVAALGDSDPLPSTGWEQTTLLAAAMAEQPDEFIRGLIDADLPTAARCASLPDVEASEALKNDLRQRLVARTQDMTADLRARIDAGLALGELSDSRYTPKIGPDRHAYLLPPLILMPHGDYPIGSDDGLEDEAPQHIVSLASFEIGKFPVTNAEYRMFIAAGGYKDERWWTSEPAKQWLSGEGTAEPMRQLWQENRKLFQLLSSTGELKQRVIEGRITSLQAQQWEQIAQMSDSEWERHLVTWFPDEQLTTPAYWDMAVFNHPSQPVVGVCWYEAQAYCAWLSAQAGQNYRLPTEIEREAAARGLAGRRFAYGETFGSLP